MAVEEIGTIIFSQILGMSQYPGSPFTGNIVNDIIMFLLVPSVFIILFVYSILGRLFASEQTKLRLLVGITIYLFIIAGGYYSAFALAAGPYFILLIFVLGVLFFVFGHFGVRRGHTMPGAALEQQSDLRALAHMPNKVRSAYELPEMNPNSQSILKEQVKQLEARRDAILKQGKPEKEALVRLDDINAEILMLERRLGRR